MRSLGLVWGVLLLVVGAAGCTHTEPYPKDWPAIPEVVQGQCPRIDGRYVNAEVDESEGCFTDNPTHTFSCNAAFLSTFLLEFSKHQSETNRGRAARWIELKQPDDNTLVIEFEKGRAPVVLRQIDGDFACSSEGPTLSGSFWQPLAHRSTFSLSFRRLEDGSLLMKETYYSRGVWLLHPLIPIPDFGTSGTAYRRWPAFAPDQESKPINP